MQRLIIGISGASGIVYGLRALQCLRALPDEIRPELHLVMSETAELTLAYETRWKRAEVEALADSTHPEKDMAAPIASGSYQTLGMLVAPASMRCCAEIAQGSGATLLTRAADVVLKEQRRLVLMARETPLHLGHLRNLVALAEMGAVIAPPVPAFYARPKSLQEMVDYSVVRVLDLFGFSLEQVPRWNEAARRRPDASEVIL